ncbi:endonuclease V [Acidihalobacter ferrooxydans]|uniref:Endonuclease V n=1 Tax=Acidihalobacter ferrooxydans TaxID=1765967 RepID=A0A1P8UKT0_9GAMM|nr:endonuclease V [Acidihalobacter ferrooxydans]
MDPTLQHAWNVAPAEARAIQERLRVRVETVDRFDGPIRTLAGVDVGFEDGGTVTRAAVVVLDSTTLQPLERVLARRATQFPYVPGLLSFREIPAVLDALAQLRMTPDLLLCDGQGIAHPRRLGIAAHLGVLLDRPSVGVAKSRLIGTHADVPDRRGAWVPLHDGEERIGAVLRTRLGVKPIYVSSGHRVALETAVEQVMRAVTRYRLPETTRQADSLASAPAHARRRGHHRRG